MSNADEPRTVEPGKISHRRVHTGRIITLDTDTVRFPDGSIGEMDMVHHPGASAIVPFLSDPRGDDPQILLLKQYRYAAGQYLYEIPAGRLDPGEEPRDCAIRELREETGCTADRVEFLTTIFTTPGFSDERIHLFLAAGLTRGETQHEADEFMTVETVTLSHALQLIEKGSISDAKTALGVLFAAGFRANH
ncbi:MAG TPA: NUDIX hydrolase [Gemmatimonadaceae bacterium]|nr:NUDIX hydrolase [Gemmatimonadaceae bacterium]